MIQLLQWITVLMLAALFGKLLSKLKMPSILGWLIVGMVFGPHALGLMPQSVLDAEWYKTVIMWMQCAFGLMLGTELVWKKLRKYGKGLVVTTMTQSLGTFLFVTLVFAVVFLLVDIPVYLAFIFGGIALATAPAPALSIVNEFHAHGPVTNTLLPMAVLDDVVAIIVFFTVNSVIAGSVSGGSIPLYMIPVMIFLPVVIGGYYGISCRMAFEKGKGTGSDAGCSVCRHHADGRDRLGYECEGVVRYYTELYADGRFFFRCIYKHGGSGAPGGNNTLFSSGTRRQSAGSYCRSRALRLIII